MPNYISAIKLPSGDVYQIKDSGALRLTGGQVTGPVNFGDSVYISDLNAGALIVTGNAAFTNNIQANTINGVEVGPNPKFTDTTYTFDGIYNASSNKVATVQTITDAINALDVAAKTGTTSQTITSISQTNGKIDATYSNISITKSQISDFPSSMAPTAHTHAYIVTEGDNRSVATTPDDYTSTNGRPNRIVFRGLKANSYINSPSSDTYSYLVGLRGWSNNSGGNAYEIAFNNTGIFVRKGATTTWDNWERLYTSGNLTKTVITNLGIPAQDTTYTFDGTYNASTNKAATVNTVTNAINNLDGNLNNTTPGAGKTLTSFSQTNGKVSATFGDISIAKSQISDFPTSMPASDVSAWAKEPVKPSYHLDEVQPLFTKTYTGIIATANDVANAWFFFGSIRPTSWQTVWSIRYRIKGDVPNQVGYDQQAEVTISGSYDVLRTYASYNKVNASLSAYYHELYRLKQAGFNSGYGHLLGVRLQSSTNPTNASYKRTFDIEILELKNCTFTFFDNFKLYNTTDIPWSGTTNYTGYSEMNYCNNGLQETGDANDANYYNRENYASRTTSAALYRYQLCLTKSNGTLVPVNSVNNSIATNKTLTMDSFDPFGEIFYWSSTSTYSAGGNVGNSALYRQYLCDLRYSFNCGGYNVASTLIARKPLYLVAVPQDDGTAELYAEPLSMQLPSSEDNLIYIYLGRVYEDSYPYRLVLSLNHPIYEYRDGAVRLYNGLKSKTAVSGGTEVSLVTTGEKYLWNSKTNNTGTVTSVAAAAASNSGITISGSPITSEGTITIGLDLNTAINNQLTEGTSNANRDNYAIVQQAGGRDTYHRRKLSNVFAALNSTDITNALGGNQNANVVFAGPDSGNAATPSFRALVAADIPGLDWSKITSGNDDLKAIEALTGTSGLLKKTNANTWTLDTSTYLTGITSSQVTSALGFTPYNATNPNGYTSNTGTVTSVQVKADTPLQSSTNTAQTSTLNTTISFVKQNANVVLAGPNSGSTTASPTFRALVEADIPSLSKSKISDFPTSWDLSNISGADDLKKIEALTGTSGFLKKTAANTWSLDTSTYLTAATLPTAASDALGGVKIGYTASGKKYPVQLDSNQKAYVQVPWADNNTTYTAGTGLSLSGTTFSNSGVTGIKGDKENSYRTGEVNLTPANIGSVNLTGDTMTGDLIVPKTRIANTYYGVSFGRTGGTPVETILYTGIKWISSQHMPIVHITGYAYGLHSPVEFKIGFYIYQNKIGYCGVTNMGAWQPQVYLFKYTQDSIDYVAVGLAGSCYYLQLCVDIQDEMGKFTGIDVDEEKWSWSFLTTAGTIPDPDGGTTCIQVPYKANILKPANATHADTATKATQDADGNVIKNTYLKLSGGTMTGGITFGNDSSAWNTKGVLFSKGSRIGENTSGGLGIYSYQILYLRPSATSGSGSEGIEISSDGLYPTNNGTESLGKTNNKWSSVYATTFVGDLNGSAKKLSQVDNITSLNDFIDSTYLTYIAKGGSNTVANKPSGVDAFGALSLKTAQGYQGQLLISSNNSSGLYWRTGIISSNAISANWLKVLDSNNYTDYTVTKSGTGANGTWGINISGTAAVASEISAITSSDNASDSDVWRNVWISYSNNTKGRPAVSSFLAYQTSTKTLKASHFLAEHISGGGKEFQVKSSTVDMALMIGSGNQNHGLYDYIANKWMIFADKNGNVTVNGNATSATTASKLGSSNVGAIDRPIYLSAGTATQTTYRMAATNAAATTARAITDDLETGIWYVNGTNSTDLYSINDGVAYVNKYNDNWIHEIYGDYRTGQIAVRGKNNGTWQSWRKILDSSNYINYMGDYVTLTTEQTISGHKTFSDLVTLKNGTGSEYCNINYNQTLGALVFSFG